MRERLVYFAHDRELGLVKIGASAYPRHRIKALHSRFGKLELMGVMKGGIQAEQRLHRQFREHRCKARGREWFFLAPAVEDFISIRSQPYISSDAPPGAQNVAVPDDIHAKLKERAKKDGMKMTAIVERALREWLKRPKAAA